MGVPTANEIKNMNKFLLRKLAKTLGLDAEEVSKFSRDELAEWVLENQKGGDQGDKGKKDTKKGRGVPGRKSEPEPEPEGKDEPEGKKEERPRGRPAARPENDDGDVNKSVLKYLKELSDKLDTIGTVVDDLVKASTDNYNELNAELFVIKGGLKGLSSRLEEEGAISEGSRTVTDDLTMEEYFQKLEDDTRGS